MFCALCSNPVKDDVKKIRVRGEEVLLHSKCLRKASKEDLASKKLIDPDDCGWWMLYSK